MHLNIKRKLEAINMQINKHGSFYIRNGWPTKIIGAITTDEHIYSPNNELKAVDTIGVGRVMIKARKSNDITLERTLRRYFTIASRPLTSSEQSPQSAH